MSSCRPLKDLPPLLSDESIDFIRSRENWAKSWLGRQTEEYQPTAAEYKLMVEAFERIHGLDPATELLKLASTFRPR